VNLKPVTLLAAATALFVAPATYLLVTSLLVHQGELPSATIPRSAEIAIWCLGGSALLGPFAISRPMTASPASVRLLIALVVSVAASTMGLSLTLLTGSTAPMLILAPASMLAVLGWSWVYRACFRALPPLHVVSRYTALIVIVAALSLVWAALSVGFWQRTVDPDIGPGPEGFSVFFEASLGVAGLAVAHLRRRASPYARPATQVFSVT
jgi:hypothetical protein